MTFHQPLERVVYLQPPAKAFLQPQTTLAPEAPKIQRQVPLQTLRRPGLLTAALAGLRFAETQGTASHARGGQSPTHQEGPDQRPDNPSY